MNLTQTHMPVLRGRRAVLTGVGFLLGTSLSGCLGNGSGEPTPTRTTTQEGPIELGPGDTGRTLQVAPGTELLIELPSNPSTGYEWTYTIEGDALTVLEDEFIQGTPAEPGTPGTRRLRVEVNGDGRIAMDYRRPWETEREPEREFNVSVVLTE